MQNLMHNVSTSRRTKMIKSTVIIFLLVSCQVFLCAVHKTPVSSFIFCSTTEFSNFLYYLVRPNIISRSQWGARRPSSVRNLAEDPAPFVVIHHSDSDSCITQAICQARVRSFQNHHMNNKNWADIGYNFLVGEDGNVYEGRGWGKHGSHSKPYNSKSIGICIIGNFNRIFFNNTHTHIYIYFELKFLRKFIEIFADHNPNAAAVKAVQDLIEYGVSLGKIQENYTLLGHRQTTQTTCPGDSLYQLIQTWPHWSSN
ncbi:hypothetical protein E2986_14107 [Frieseomelitta varia]|uniref:Peptidoglycan-recognition protein n=1 Tax=Frieseomelitta varia TaxID=561572 RepID=A0A833VQS4_9HYME|nr:hypothetical protein E2986_14107 [Frieseomelitta varia]